MPNLKERIKTSRIKTITQLLQREKCISKTQWDTHTIMCKNSDRSFFKSDNKKLLPTNILGTILWILGNVRDRNFLLPNSKTN